MRVPHDGLVFDVAVAGPDDGPAVLLLHGFPQDHTCWDLVVGDLHARGLRTIAPDLRGYSPDARPDDPAAYRTSEMVGDAVAILDHLDVATAHVVGHDWGGVVAWATAMGVPERVDTLTVLSTPHPAALAKAMRTSTQGLRSWYFLLFRSRIAERLVLPRLRGLLMSSGMPRSSAMRAGERMDQPGAFSAALNYYRGMDTSLFARASDVTVPTTLAWGTDDPFFGRAAALGTAGHVAADYRLVAVHGDHWLPETEPEAVTRILRDRVSTPHP
ncbi:alpha/beta fold hydrolase [Salsipaludibacter albus]|uniref:alpha/beta fold hydrolase n=1 Tax=Salsipaludibacter albus TaxID=2849650 RepID=UPI003B75BA4D